jgi:hypothetical protein
MKQAIKKGSTVKAFDLSAFKAKMNCASTNEKDLTMSNADKPLSFITMPEAFANAIKLPGFPMGYMSIITGWSNTGKSTLLNCLIASCVNNGILPIIYDTENNFDFSYARDCGLKAEPIYGDVEVETVDEETGEVTVTTERQIIEWEGDFIYFNSRKLAEAYGNMDYSQGKQVSKKRKTAVIEDIAYSMNDFLDKQDDGELPMPICFIWDSVGSCIGWKSYSSKVGNPMFDAASLSSSFTNILNARIPSSRSVASPYTNSFVCVNKIWNDSMNSMSNVPSIELKGGKSFFYAARLIIHVGGVSKSSIKKLSATAKGSTYNYGIISKIRVNKNQLPTPWNITYEGEIACVHNGLWCPDDMESYKKQYMKDILKMIEESGSGKTSDVSEKDVVFDETDETE